MVDFIAVSIIQPNIRIAKQLCVIVFFGNDKLLFWIRFLIQEFHTEMKVLFNDLCWSVVTLLRSVPDVSHDE